MNITFVKFDTFPEPLYSLLKSQGAICAIKLQNLINTNFIFGTNGRKGQRHHTDGLKQSHLKLKTS